jgi:hypothetical protein
VLFTPGPDVGHWLVSCLRGGLRKCTIWATPLMLRPEFLLLAIQVPGTLTVMPRSRIGGRISAQHAG